MLSTSTQGARRLRASGALGLRRCYLGRLLQSSPRRSGGSGHSTFHAACGFARTMPSSPAVMAALPRSPCGLRRSSGGPSGDDGSRMGGPGVQLKTPDVIPLHPFILDVLRGMGQVVFCNSVLTGSLVTAGLLVGDPRCAALALAGCTSATAAARHLKFDATRLKAGLYGYNGALVGCAFSFGLLAPTAIAAAAACAGGVATAFAADWFGRTLGAVPQLTLAANAVALAVLAVRRPLVYVEPVGQPPSFWMLDSLDWLSAILGGVSQIFCVNSMFTGAAVIFGIATYSPLAAAATLVGSIVGAVAAILGGGAPDEVVDGRWGCCPALTALAVSVLFVPTGGPYLALVAAGSAAAAVASVALQSACGAALHAPALTLPFCAAAAGCYALGGRVPGLVLARVPHSPEANLFAYRGY